MPTREYFDWWEVACTSRFLSPADALDDPRLDGLPDNVPATATQQRDTLALPADVPLTGRSCQRFRPDIKRQSRGGRGRGADGEPQRPVGAIDSEEEAEYDRQKEGGVGTSGHDGEAGTQQTYVTGVDRLLVRIFRWMMHSSTGPSMTFRLHSGDRGLQLVAGRYQRARAAAAAVEHLAPIRPPPPSHGEDLSWIPPITPLSHGFTSSAPAFHPWGAPPSWEYPVSHSGSGGSQHQSAPPQ
ncbi:hypothetical protein PIB30_011399 [Stylosanthes scabra]|uniref:Uncharacterized protein n=1 Tax=Stylosanthes scabra TaxID=79078 RepID=A0ABU6Z680_9FABA|nr:hypothetical protein [Stylosanthes scabra]